MPGEPTLDDWEKCVPEAIRGDALWRVKAYRLALFAADVGWPDVTRLAQDRRTVSGSDQLYRALGSISSNLAEGYSRGSGRDRVRFYEYSLGSVREARNEYFRGRHILGDDLAFRRIERLSEIARLILAMIPSERNITFREPEPPEYEAG